jgi:hypothetical protein
MTAKVCLDPFDSEYLLIAIGGRDFERVVANPYPSPAKTESKAIEAIDRMGIVAADLINNIFNTNMR